MFLWGEIGTRMAPNESIAVEETEPTGATVEPLAR